jgi:transcriptional regulator with XRE-family HTH domain
MTSHRIQQLPKDLIECRKKQGVTLAEIATKTKINARYLEAIERGDFKKLPGGVYTLSYLRQYANAIDCDENDLLRYYREVAGPDDEPVEAPPEDGSWFGRICERVIEWIDGDMEDGGPASGRVPRKPARRVERPPTARTALSNRCS